MTAGLAALLAASLIVGRADGAGTSWSVYVAPEGACRSADDPAAAADVQARAVTCLVNWARAHDSRKRLVRRRALQHAATLKGERVASCGQFSHTPCGTAVTAAVRAAGYRYATFGENLFAGTWGQISARDVVTAWLQSPEHRANVLGASFKDLWRRSRSCARPPRRRRCGRLDGDVRLASIDRAGVEPEAGRTGPCARRATSTICATPFAATSSDLAARRGEQELMHVSEPETPEEAPKEPPQPEPEPTEPRRSWLARMLST